MDKIKVVGHLCPDTDSTCSAISYAWFLKNHKNLDATGFVLGEINREAEFVLNKFGVKQPERIKEFKPNEKVVIVDTNNIDELPKSISKAKILEIVDHHKLCSGLSTDSPIPVTIRPVACTATVIWQKMKEEKVKNIPSEIAGLMLSAILSDTLKFTSPTTTDEDKKAVEEILAICNEDIDKLSEEMFEAKSNLTGMSEKDLLLEDSKEYETKEKKIRYSVLETTKPENALLMKEKLIQEMKNIKEEEKLDYLFFLIVDIIKSESFLLTSTDKERQIAEKAFSKKFVKGELHLPGVVSRKKQLIPSIEPLIIM